MGQFLRFPCAGTDPCLHALSRELDRPVGKHNGKSLATVACSWNVNAPNCLKVLLKLDATVLGPRSPTMRHPSTGRSS